MIEAMKQALEALEESLYATTDKSQFLAFEAITALRTAIEQADEQEAWKTSDTAYRPEGLPQDFIKHEVDSFDDWSEWVCPDPTQYFMKCCDCGLVHEMQFNVVKYSAGDKCEDVDDPHVQAVFRARRTTPPAAPVQDSTCNKTLRAEGKGYPRTCMKCGKGPCIADRVQPEHEPVAQIIALGQYEFPGLEWLSADHSFRAPIGTLLYTTPPAAPVQEPVKPYAYEYGRDNGDGTYSVVIDKGSLVQTQPAVYNYARPQNAHKEWPIKELFDHPPAAQRQWVGLTDEDCKGLNVGDMVVAMWADRVLKEKNI